MRRYDPHEQQPCFLVLPSPVPAFPSEEFESFTPGDLLSSNTPRLILSRISRAASSNAQSTFRPDLALASTNSKPSSFAHHSASAVGTSLRLWLAAPSSHRSTLLPTRIHVRCGSACARTSASHDRASRKLARFVTSYTSRQPAAPR